MLGSATLTLWIVAGPAESPLCWFPWLKGKDAVGPVLSFLIAIGVTNLGLGYLCNVLFVMIMFFVPRARYVRFENLEAAVKLPGPSGCSWGQRRKFRDDVLATFHLRLHTEAPSTLIDWCARRNTAWYLAKTSAFAIVIGPALASYLIVKNHDRCGIQLIPWGWIAAVGLAAFLSFLLLWVQGTRWNKEYWTVMWIWLGSDLRHFGHPTAGRFYIR